MTWAWKSDCSVQGLKKEQTHAQTTWGPVGHAHSDGVPSAVQQPGASAGLLCAVQGGVSVGNRLRL